jgi:N-acetylglucosamine kinase-like BadF-type ATPase
VGLTQALANIDAAIVSAWHGVGERQPARAAWFGLAGVDRPDDYQRLLPHLQTLAETVAITNDVELVLSALDDLTGIALIAGTGSIALGRDLRGQISRVGGWGHLLGDEGSGYDLGRLALQAVLRAADGRSQATVLTALVMDCWHLTESSDILSHAYGDTGKSRIAELAPLVLQAAYDGDVVAGRILRRAAHELALAMRAVSRNLAFPNGTAIPLAFGGGLLVKEPAFRDAVLRRWRRYHPEGPVVLVKEPALSAARAAMDGLKLAHTNKKEEGGK